MFAKTAPGGQLLGGSGSDRADPKADPPKADPPKADPPNADPPNATP
jgi:hypothetical protein